MGSYDQISGGMRRLPGTEHVALKEERIMSARLHVRMLVVLLVGCILFATTAQAQTTWYVDDDAPNDPGPGDPLVSDPLENGSPEHPFDAIQEGIDAAVNGDTVLVLDGTYTGDGNKNLDFGGRNITVRSENGPDNCIIDCEASGRGFYFHSDEGPASVVDGLTITNGLVAFGGAIYCFFSSPTVNNCIIAGNIVHLDGGGIWCYQDSNPTISNCIITGNTVHLEGGGGAIYCYQGSSPTIANCIIADNAATYEGGGIYVFDGCPKIINCTIAGNTASSGGGIYCYQPSSPTISNCTITRNSGSGITVYGSQSIPTITNSILWGNSADEIELDEFNPADPVVRYCDVEGGWPGEGNINADPLFVDPDDDDYRLASGSPCVDAGCNCGVPRDIADLDNDGDTDEITPLDLDGEGRFFDDPNTPDTGCGSSPIVDMGAYEFGGTGPQPCFGDLDGDQDVDLSDLAGLLANYGQAEVCEGDLDCDGDVDLTDLAALLAVYGTTCE